MTLGDSGGLDTRLTALCIWKLGNGEETTLGGDSTVFAGGALVDGAGSGAFCMGELANDEDDNLGE